LRYSPLRGLDKVNNNTRMVNGTKRNIAGDNVSHKFNALHIRANIDLDERSTHIRAIDVRVGKAR
jgi:hypothetical protein